MVNTKKQKYVDLVIDYVKKFPNKFNKLVVYGESIDSTIEDPTTIDFAVGLVREEDAKDYELLGDLLSYIGDIVDEGNCSLVPIDSNTISNFCMSNILKGEIVYEIC